MIHQLMFGGDTGFTFDAVTGTGQFVYVEYPSGDSETLNYSAATMTTAFNDRNNIPLFVPQSVSGTLTVNFNFTVPTGYKLYLAARMGDQMNKSLSTIDLNGTEILNGWPDSGSGTPANNVLVANSGTSVSTMTFFGNTAGSGFNDGYVIKITNFIIVPNSESVTAVQDFNSIMSNVSGAVATG